MSNNDYNFERNRALQAAVIDTSFCACINGFRLFGLYPRLVQIASYGNYAITVSSIMFDILRWALCGGSDVSTPYMSENLPEILDPACSKNNFHFDIDSMNSFPTAA